MSPIRLLIADDQELIRTGFRLFLDGQPDMEVVGEAADGLEAVERCRALLPDVVLMDIRMPRLDGVEATRTIAGAPDRPGPKVVVLTTFDLDEDIFGALRAGASAFLLKDAPRERLLEAVRVAHAGGHGIVGMRERVRVYGGELTAQPRPDGGFLVRARIPLAQAELVTA